MRREVIARLKAAAIADPEQRRSTALRQKLSELLQGAKSLKVGIYAPLAHEVNLLPLLKEHPQHRYYFPLCLPGHQLEFREVRSIDADLVPGAMGILAPAAHTPAISPQDIDILIVPGVAFTRKGDRMGYGGGYYDRFIPRCTRAKVLALVFAEQLCDPLPTEAHDLRIPLIITAEVT